MTKVLILCIVLLGLLLCACVIDDGGDWSDMDRSWMTDPARDISMEEFKATATAVAVQTATAR